MVEDLVDVAVVLLVDRPGEFAADEEVRQVGEEFQVREALQKVEDEEQVGGHPVAVGLDIDREVDLLGEPPPALDQRDAVVELPRADVGLDVEMVEAELGRVLERRLEVVDRLREALALGGEVVLLSSAPTSAGTCRGRASRC